MEVLNPSVVISQVIAICRTDGLVGMKIGGVQVLEGGDMRALHRLIIGDCIRGKPSRWRITYMRFHDSWIFALKIVIGWHCRVQRFLNKIKANEIKLCIVAHGSKGTNRKMRVLYLDNELRFFWRSSRQLFKRSYSTLAIRETRIYRTNATIWN